MSITFLSNPIHLPDFFKFDREYLGKQESQNEDQKVFHKDTLEVSQLSKNRENLMEIIVNSVSPLSRWREYTQIYCKWCNNVIMEISHCVSSRLIFNSQNRIGIIL